MNCNCFPCFSGNNESDDTDKNEDLPMAQAITPPPTATTPPPRVCADNRTSSVGVDDKDEPFDPDEGNTKAKAFTFRELASATKNFRQECLLGEGGFGRVFRGTLQSSGQVIAVRQLERSATQGSNDFQVEVLMLSLLRHPNLVPLIGYCADGEQRLLVYEYMPSGPLEKHLFDISADRKPLKWQARMKIASGIAQGLEYLHEKANPPIVYRDLKSSNVLLDETNNPRLSDYGLVKLMQNGNKMHLSPNMTTSGYCAPEFESHGELTLKSDVYSFGVVLLELISGRRALDSTGPSDEQNLVTWAESFFRDPKRFPEMADPLLKGGFPITSLNQAVGVAAMCLQEEPLVRPMISDIVAALSFLAMAPPDAPIPTRLAPILSARVETLNYRGTRLSNLGEGSVTRHKKEDSSDSEDEEHKIHSNDDQEEEGQDSDVDQTDSSDSDCEEEKTEHVKKIKKSGKWSSSKKSSSFGSMNSSTGFSLRCDSTYPDRNLSHLDSRQDIIHESHEYHSGSSSDEESFRESFKSSSRHSSRNRRLPSINSRNSSKKDLHNVSLNSNTSSDKKQYSHEKSSGSRSRKYDNVEISMENVEIGLESDDESEFVYSGDSSSVGSDCGDHSPKRGD